MTIKVVPYDQGFRSVQIDQNEKGGIDGRGGFVVFADFRKYAKNGQNLF